MGPGKTELSVEYSSMPEQCGIELGKHKVVIRDKGNMLGIDGNSFGINPGEQPHFVVSVKDGKTLVTRGNQGE